jgi:hypothetical protein
LKEEFKEHVSAFNEFKMSQQRVIAGAVQMLLTLDIP